MRFFKRSYFRIPYWAYAFVLFVLVVNTFSIISRFQMPYDGIGYKVDNGQCIIKMIRIGSPAEKAGLHSGDIIEIFGSSHMTVFKPSGMLEPHRAGDTVSYHVIRGNAEMNISVNLKSSWSQNPWLYFILNSLILIVSTTSLYILYRKPFDFTARIFFIYLQLLAIALNFNFLYLYDSYTLIVPIAFILSFNLFGAVLFHFYLIFPGPLSLYKRYKGILKVIYVIAVLFGTVATLLLVRIFYTDSDAAVSAYIKFFRWSIGWMGLSLFAALILAFHQYITTKSALARKQLRLVVIGSVFGLVTPILFSIYPEFVWKIAREQNLLTMLEFANVMGTYIMTTFLVIAIFRYRLWSIEIFIRRAILYSTASVLIVIVNFILLYLVNILAIEESRITHLIVLAASIILFLFLRDFIQRMIDRFFHRESYDSAKTITEFEDKLAGIYNIEEMRSIVIHSLNDIFHFKSFVYALRMDKLTYKPVYMSGIDNYPFEGEFEITMEIYKLLLKSNVFAIEALNEEPEFFKIFQGEMIVSLMTGPHPFGFILVGPKMSDKSYSLQDIRMLSLLARRIITFFNTARLYQKDLDRKLVLERERMRISKDVHDDVGASLTRISILSELVKNNASDPGKIKPWIQQISETSHEVIQELTQIIWALNPKNDAIEGLVAYIRRFASEYLEMTSVKCNFELPEEITGLAFSGEVRRNIFLTMKEALNNVIKHAGATKVGISMKVNDQGFIILIKDDGKGFDPNNLESFGNGLINMEKRMNAIGGAFSIRSKEKEGTVISLVVPIKPGI